MTIGTTVTTADVGAVPAAVTAPAAPAATPTAAPKLTLGTVKSQYFSPAAMQAAIEAIQALQTDGVSPVITNGDWASTGKIAPGYGIAIRPVSKTVEKTDSKGQKYNERETMAVGIFALPALEALMETAEGTDFVRAAVNRVMEQKATSAILRADGDYSNVSLPYSIESFIQNAGLGATGIGLKSYTDLAPTILERLRGMNITVDKQILRLILQSTDFANKLLPRVPQPFWVRVLQAAKAAAITKALPVTVFDHWLVTRDTVSGTGDTAITEDTEFNIA